MNTHTLRLLARTAPALALFSLAACGQTPAAHMASDARLAATLDAQVSPTDGGAETAADATADGTADATLDGSPDAALKDGHQGDASAGSDATRDAAQDATHDTQPDAGPAPALAVVTPCGDAVDDVYTTPADLPAWDPAAAPELHGALVRCAADGVLSVAQVGTRLAVQGITLVPERGVRRYRVAYRTERADGVPVVGTALVVVPEPPPPTPPPLVVAAHGTAGLADQCAPSKAAAGGDYLTLPFATTGAVVVAPDYAGLGNEGIEGYGDARDTAHSLLDASRAAAALFPPGALSGQVAITGHSQGGGATLQAVALAPSYAPELDLIAGLPFAPGWVSSPDLNAKAYRFPQFVSTSLAAGVAAAVTVLGLYADQANAAGVDQAGRFFHPDVRQQLVALIESLCVFDLAVEVPKLAPTFAGLMDPAFTAGVLACLDDGLAASTCVEPYAGYVARAQANYLPLDDQAPPLLYIQGGADAQATPDRAACNVQALVGMGAAPQVCVDATATHFTVVARQVAFATQWLSAIAAGEPPPSCLTVGVLPPCVSP